MSKELEALIRQELKLLKDDIKGSNVVEVSPMVPHIGINKLDAKKHLLEHIETIERLLTPPTADEVCEALSRYLKSEVKYIPHRLRKNGFYLVDSGIYLVSLGYDNQVNFSYNDWMKFNRLPPHLITLIGRFYEALK